MDNKVVPRAITPLLIDRTIEEGVGPARAETFTAISNRVMISISIIQASTHSMVSKNRIGMIQLIDNSRKTNSMKKLKIFIGRNSSALRRIGRTSMKRGSKEHKISKRVRRRLISSVIPRKKRSGLVDTHVRRKNFTKNILLGAITIVSKITHSVLHQIQMTKSIMIKILYSINLSMQNQSQKKKRCIRSMSPRKTQIFIRRIVGSTPVQIYFLTILG